MAFYQFIAMANDTDEEMRRAKYGEMGVVLHAFPVCISLQELAYFLSFLLFFLSGRFLLCLPGWSAVTQS